MPKQQSDSATAMSNLALFDGRLMREAEKRLPMINELAVAAADTFAAVADDGLLAFLPGLAAHKSAVSLSDGCLPIHEPFLRPLRETLSALDRVAMLSGFRTACEARGISLDCSSFFSEKEQELHRIAYVRNIYTEEAYEIFTADDSEATLLYTDSFREACEAVSDGQADFCILPFENSAGPLTSFSELAARFSLTVAALCRVFHAEGTDATRFALLAKHPLSSCGGKTPCLRLSFLVENGEALATHITAFLATGASLLSLSSGSDAAGEYALSCTLTLRCPRESAFLPLAYFYTFTDFPKLLGFYEEIEE